MIRACTKNLRFFKNLMDFLKKSPTYFAAFTKEIINQKTDKLNECSSSVLHA